MAKANKSLFILYLALLDSFSRHLSLTFPNGNAVCPNHIKANIIAKTVRMLHTLEKIINDGCDEVSARCVLRGVLDSITTYCFIYDRDNENDILFRHYLYALDGFRSYKSSVVECISEKNNTRKDLKDMCDSFIKQIEDILAKHPYFKEDNNAVNTIVRNANWKYKSLKDIKSWNFSEMYELIGFSKSLARYFQGYLSQFSHGLCLSNTLRDDEEILKDVLYESIVIEQKTINVIKSTFPKENWTKIALSYSDSLMALLNNSEIKREEYIEFINSRKLNDGILEIS